MYKQSYRKGVRCILSRSKAVCKSYNFIVNMRIKVIHWQTCIIVESQAKMNCPVYDSFLRMLIHLVKRLLEKDIKWFHKLLISIYFLIIKSLYIKLLLIFFAGVQCALTNLVSNISKSCLGHRVKLQHIYVQDTATSMPIIILLISFNPAIIIDMPICQLL